MDGKEEEDNGDAAASFLLCSKFPGRRKRALRSQSAVAHHCLSPISDHLSEQNGKAIVVNDQDPFHNSITALHGAKVRILVKMILHVQMPWIHKNIFNLKPLQRNR